MRSIQKIYRSNYLGENVITDMTYEGGNWKYQSEDITAQVYNNQISNIAVVVGNGISRSGFDLNLIKNHKGGLLANRSLQSYGCNALYRDFSPNFLVAVGDGITEEIATSGYTTDHIVYSNAKTILDYPGKFYLTPQDPEWNAGTTAAYLACFDEHKTVYMLGFDGIDDSSSGYNIYNNTNGYSNPGAGHNEEYWSKAMLTVFGTYPEVDFVRVMPLSTYRMPEAWKYVPNLRQIDFRQFAIEVDL